MTKVKGIRKFKQVIKDLELKKEQLMDIIKEEGTEVPHSILAEAVQLEIDLDEAKFILKEIS